MSPNPKEKESLLSRLTEIIDKNLGNDQFGVNELASEMGMSRSNLHRKVKSLTGSSASKYICGVKVKRAQELLRDSTSTISEIAFETGFHSVSYFTKCYRDHFGYPPGEERKQDGEGRAENDLLAPGIKKVFGKKIQVVYLFAMVLVITLAVLLLLILKPVKHKAAPADKAIAVLPFINDSPDQTEMYFINGTMEAILNNLGKIEDLRVVSRTSVEQYRNNPKPTPVVGEEMKVSYVLEGSGHRDGDMVRLYVQLIDAKRDQHLWSKSYEASMDEIFSVQSEIAQLVAGEIEVIVTPKEMALIEKIPTTSRTAYDLYLRGMEEKPMSGFWYLDNETENTQKSEDLFRLALEYDSTFAEVYAQMAFVYNLKYRWETHVPNSYLDSISFYLEKAFHFDDQLAEAFVEMGWYYDLLGDKEKSLDSFSKALELDPNNSAACIGFAWIYQSFNDFRSAISYYHKAELINRGPALKETYARLANAYFMIGCYDQSHEYSKQMLALVGDSVDYYVILSQCEYFIRNNTAEAIKLLERAYVIDPEDSRILGTLAEVHFDLGNFKEALSYVEKKNESLITTNQADYYQAFISGFIYQKNGYAEQANFYFDQQIDYCHRLLDTQTTMFAQLAFAYCGKGEKVKAMEFLEAFNQLDRMSVYVLRNLEDDHYYESIQDEPEFQKIRSELITKYKAEHDRVMNWLEENDRL